MPYKNKADQAAAAKRHYENNKDLYKERAVEHTKKNRKKLREYINYIKATTSCADCGKYYPPYVMDFDHLRDKKFNIGNLDFTSLSVLENEILKCEIVCSNCHRIRTHNRLLH